MRTLAIILVLGSAMAGCATNVRHGGEGYALSRETPPADAAVRDLIPERDPARYWSVRDFVQPRGLLQ